MLDGSEAERPAANAGSIPVTEDAPCCPAAAVAQRLVTESRPLLLGAAVVWALGAMLLLGRWLLGYCCLWRLLRRTEPVPERVARLLEEMAAGQPPPRLVVSHRARVPLSCGLLRPTIVLPTTLCRTADAAMLRWVFAHELTHLQRRDAWTTLLFALGQSVYYFLPWYWWLRRQVRLCQEYIADAAAVAEHRRPAHYAQFLLSLTTTPRVPAGASGVSGHSSDLYRRVTMLLQAPVAVERACPRLCSLAMAGGLLALAVLASGIGLRAEVAAPAAEEPMGAAPGPGASRAVVPSADQPARDEPPKEEGRGKPARVPSLELPDIEELLQRLPAGIDPQHRELIRKELERSLAETKKAIDRAREEMRKALEQARPGAAIEIRPLRINRDDERRLGARLNRPGDVLAAQLDLSRGQGMVVEQLLPDSAAAKAGIRINDILLEVNGKAVPSEPRELARMLDAIKADAPVDAVVLRKGQKETVKGLVLPEVKPLRRPTPRIQVPRPLGPIPAVPQRVVPIPFAAGPTTTMARNGDEFTTRYHDGSVTILVTGTASNRTVTVAEIRIAADGLAAGYASLDEVPEAYRERARGLIEISSRGTASIRNATAIGH